MAADVVRACYYLHVAREDSEDPDVTPENASCLAAVGCAAAGIEPGPDPLAALEKWAAGLAGAVEEVQAREEGLRNALHIPAAATRTWEELLEEAEDLVSVAEVADGNRVDTEAEIARLRARLATARQFVWKREGSTYTVQVLPDGRAFCRRERPEEWSAFPPNGATGGVECVSAEWCHKGTYDWPSADALFEKLRELGLAPEEKADGSH